MPMSVKTRPAVLGALHRAMRDRLFLYLPVDTVGELGTFVYRDTKPSPRAQEGCYDDCVMSLAIAVSLLNRYAEPIAPRSAAKASTKRGRWRRQQYKPHPARQTV